MKKTIITIVTSTVFFTAFYVFAQSEIYHGLYSICDPEGKYLDAERQSLTVKDIIGDDIKDVSILEFRGGWKDKNQAKEQLVAKLKDPKIEATSLPYWNLDMPVELIGTIEFKDGTKGKIAVAQHRVGFQDKKGKPWYFQWEERIPWKDKK